MKFEKPTEIFKYNILFLKIFGVWMGRQFSTKYYYYSLFYLTLTIWLYDLILTVNIIFTPLEIQLWIKEFLLYCAEFILISKVLTFLMMREKVFEIFDMIDSSVYMKNKNDTFIREKAESIYKKYFIFLLTFGHGAFVCYTIIPILRHIFFGNDRSLPVSNYYFLNDELREKYFYFLWIYQVGGIYGHMIYNITIDTFFGGLLLLGVVQFKILNKRLSRINMKQGKKHSKENIKEQYNQQMNELKDCLMHYNSVLKYCSLLQNFFSVAMFFIYSVSTCVLCITLYALQLETSREYNFFLVHYIFVKLMQIFIPSFLGTQLTYESQQLSVAIYKSNWVDSSRTYKRAMMLLTERSHRPVVLSGMKWFTLSLKTFTSIMKTAYSFFTLLKSFEQ